LINNTEFVAHYINFYALSSNHQRWAGQDQDWISCWIFAILFETGLDLDKKIGSGQQQDICLISITKFPW